MSRVKLIWLRSQGSRRTREIRGFALVDEADWPLVKDYRWHRNGNHAYAYGAGAMHRFLLGLERGDRVVHHANENGCDNRRANLVICADRSEAQRQPHPIAAERMRRRIAERMAARTVA